MFNSPANTNNVCSDSQKNGFDWKDLQPGSFSQYDGFQFSGFQCANSFGKRDTLTKRTFNSKCIKGRASRDSGPSFSCGQTQKGFSITEMHVSSERDSDLEFHFGMEDGSTCRQTTRCQAGGSIISNTQCGGAKKVIVKVPQHEKTGCDIGIHSVIFDCQPPQNSPPPSLSSSSSAAPSSPPPVITSPVESSPASSKPPSLSSPVPSYPLSNSTTPSSTGEAPPPVSSATPDSPVQPPPESPSVPMTTSTIMSTQTITITSCSEAITDCPAASTVIATSIIAISTTVCPVSEASNPPSPPSSTPGDAVPSSSAPAPSQPSESAPSTPSDTPPAVPPQCPEVLPKCMNTWLFKSGCRDNTDSSCYCKNPDFTKSVIACVTSWGADQTLISKALTFLTGICAEQIPENPGIITDCPSSIPIGPTTPPSSPVPSLFPTGSPVQPSQPAESDVVVTEIVQTTVTTCPAGQTVTSGTVTKVLETPSVSTILITTTSTICTKCAEVPTTPATTPAGPVASSPAPSPPPASVPAPARVPMTTIYVSQTVTVPCTSNGTPIPSSSTTSLLTTAVTVPAVQFTVGSSSSVNLVPITTSASPAAPVASSPVQSLVTASFTSVPQIKSTLGTTIVPGANRTTTGSLAQFTGGAARVAGQMMGVVAGGVLAALII